MSKRKLVLLILSLFTGFLTSKDILAQTSLPGNFNLGNCSDNLCDFTYNGEPGWSTTLTGYIYTPPGSDPFPAIVISHGKGGGGAGFCVLGRDWLPSFIAICPNYTHAGGSIGGGGPDGGSPENVKRATRALDILESAEFANQLNINVDSSRLYLYGNSMGGFVTIETVSSIGTRIKAAAYTASGLVDPYTPSGPDQAQHIQAPFLMLHGEKDGTVDPQASRDFAAALDTYGKPYNLVWFPNGEHNLIYEPATNSQVFQHIDNWFSGTVPTQPPTTPSPTPLAKPGDANGEGLVDGLDFIVFMNHFGQSTPNGARDGDFSGNGTVGSEDYGIWSSNYTLP